ncbi:MAG: GNAT family N-acetyltransferase [Clostridia bacterium]|nr:GNAT family N-acetyltransferase [Clostridia bacterium]MBR4459005.1 GNAT family N-acetyltransferase [Clostridia bacterium]
MNRTDYTLAFEDASAAPELYALMHETWAAMENKELFAVGDLDETWVREVLTPPGFAVTARSAAGALCGMLMVCFHGEGEENLGYDIGLTGDELTGACCLECAAVRPEDRGHGLEHRMFIRAEERLRGMGVRHVLMTVSPYNPASLRSAQKAGYRILLTKEKYGGMLRHVLGKTIPGEDGTDGT